MLMSEPVIPKPKPFLVNVSAGRTYYWCSCGQSKRQPFCDGSHAGTGFEPLQYKASTDDELLFCGCKHTRTPPFCDGAHTNLPGGSPLDDPNSEQNRGVAMVEIKDGARAQLNGNCYVFSPAEARMLTQGNLRYCELVSPAQGSLYQTQLYIEATDGPAPVLSMGSSDVILFVSEGAGKVNLSGRDFAVKPLDGVYIRPSEGVQITADPGQTLKIFLLACPAVAVSWLASVPDNFDSDFQQRVVPVDASQKTDMGPRYFQVLVDKRIGSAVITQFIGHIPQSKAASHRHLYEEALIILSGEGVMWTENRKARVTAGDVIFLPRKQIHSLQAVSDEGMDVVGVICPGDNPSINYYD
jgi:mannose-6-phosphate isomerase-like protein (cupin superfamily)/CDGSH-type Zn-finger protein